MKKRKSRTNRTKMRVFSKMCPDVLMFMSQNVLARGIKAVEAMIARRTAAHEEMQRHDAFLICATLASVIKPLFGDIRRASHSCDVSTDRSNCLAQTKGGTPARARPRIFLGAPRKIQD